MKKTMRKMGHLERRGKENKGRDGDGEVGRRTEKVNMIGKEIREGHFE